MLLFIKMLFYQTVIAPPPVGRVTLVPAVMLATLKIVVAVIVPVPPPMLPISPTVFGI